MGIRLHFLPNHHSICLNPSLNHSDCESLKKSGKPSGTYSINPDGKGFFEMYCDMESDGGGWTVIQRRVDGSVDFDRDWSSYKQGFGSLLGNLWLGNDKIHRFTASGSTELRVDLGEKANKSFHYKYDKFFVADETYQYRLTFASRSGTPCGLLCYSHAMYFSTRDRVNEPHDDVLYLCAHNRGGARWYPLGCGVIDINGRCGSLYWTDTKREYQVKKSVVKISKPQSRQ